MSPADVAKPRPVALVETNRARVVGIADDAAFEAAFAVLAARAATAIRSAEVVVAFAEIRPA